MRKLILLILFGVLLLVGLVVVAVGLGVHWAGSLNGMTVMLDGERLEAPAVAALIGVAAAFGVVIATLVLFAVLASVAIVIPFVLAVVFVSLVVALFAGLAPIAIPVLLVVGAYVLLFRRATRKNEPAALPPTTSLT